MVLGGEVARGEVEQPEFEDLAAIGTGEVRGYLVKEGGLVTEVAGVLGKNYLGCY